MNNLNIKLRHKAKCRKTCRNPKTWEAEEGHGVQGQTWLYSQLKANLGYLRST